MTTKVEKLIRKNKYMDLNKKLYLKKSRK